MGSGFSRHVHTSAHDSRQVLTFQGKSCSHFASFTRTREVVGKYPEGSTESASMIEFCVQGSIKAEPLWLVPLSERSMPGNEWKSVWHLFY